MIKRQLFSVIGLIVALAASQSVWAQQYAYPTGTIGSTADYTFSTTGHWQDVGEGRPWNDATFIESTANPGIIEFALGNLVEPNDDTNHIIRFRSINTSNNHRDFIITLRDNGSDVAQSTIRVPKGTNVWTEFSFPITTAVINDYGALSVAFSVNGSSPAPGSISWVELQIPDAAVVPAVVDTLPATNPTEDGATLWGEITTDGTPTATLNIEWGETSGNYNLGDQPVGTGAGQFSIDVSGLDPDTTYFYRAWADNGVRVNGAEEPFTTAPAAVLPTVTTRTVENITQTSAVLGGNVTADGNATVTERGIYWQVDNPNSQNGNKVPMGSGLGEFFNTVSLPAGKTIYYRAYAINSAGEQLGSEPAPFNTPAGPPAIDTPVAQNIEGTRADLGATIQGDGGAAVTARGVEWGDASGNYPNVVPHASGGTGFFTVDTTGFTPGTTIYFRAYATNTEGTSYTNESSFIARGEPIVTTSAAANITHNSADLGGEVTSDEGAAVTARGIYWQADTGNSENGTKVPMGSGTGLFSNTVSGLPSGKTIFFRTYAVNAAGEALGNELSFPTETEPTVQASNIVFDVLAGRSMRITWTRGNGDGVIVVLRETGVTIANPVDGTNYAANPDYSFPPEPTGAGNFVVYTGAHNSLLVYGLTEGTSYTVAIYEYAGSGASIDYLLPAVEKFDSTTNTRVHNYDYGLQCDQCHNHSGFMARDTELEDVCRGCHADGQVAELKQEFNNHLSPVSNPGVDFVDCGVCHELHRPDSYNTTESTHSVTLQTQNNKSFLRANVSKHVSTVPAPGGVPLEAFLHNDTPKREDPHPDAPQAADTPDRAIEGGNETSARGYCQVCHTMTDYHRSNAAASTPSGNSKPGLMQCHNGDQNDACASEVHCGDCHEHNNSFVGVNNNLPCEQCHNQLGQGSRPIITTQFDGASSHIPGGSADAVKANCLVCHDQATHPTGFVRGLDLDDGTTSWTHDTARQDTLATGVGEVFEPHCLSCHDDGSADSLAADSGAPTPGQTQSSPFTDSDQPPVINETYWASAGHNRPSGTFPSTPVSCVGGGANGCHASGHGTDELSLLAPITSEPGVVSDSSKFCMQCHDSSISSTDIRIEFDPAAAGTGWRTQADGNALVNQRHDIFDADQTYNQGAETAPGVVVCADCHSPHADNTAAPVANPDTGDPLNTYSAANHGGGADPTFGASEPDMIEFCNACHDGAGGSSQAGNSVLSPNLVQIGGAGGTYESDFHGTGFGGSGGNGFLKPPFQVDTDYASLQCTICHGAHGSDNIFNLRSSITVGAGTPSETIMSTGGWDTGKADDIGFVVGTTYTLEPAGGGAQENMQWGAWCSFCHQMEAHGLAETKTCNSGHKHGGGKM
jgi:hypothetical protein